MQQRNWFFLFLTNFVGVFNDNFLKYSLIYVSSMWLLPDWMDQAQIISILSAAMVIPYVLLTPLSGYLSNRYEKIGVLRLFKWLELPIILIALVGFYYQQIWVAAFAVLLMGIQSCLYSPAKYGLIRDIGGCEGASFGSGVFEAMAFLGILLGTVLASVISDHYHFYYLLIVMLFLVCMGVVGSSMLRVHETPVLYAHHKSFNPLLYFVSMFRFCRSYKGLNLSIFGASMLWFLGALLQMNLVLHASQVLHCSNTASGLLLAIAAIGIALGTFVAGRVSGKGVRTELIYVGHVGVLLSLLLILLFKPSYMWLFLPIFGVAFCGGLFQVPCLAIVQRSEVGRRLADVVAFMNLFLFILILLASLIFSLLCQWSGQNSYVVFGFMLLSTIASLLVFVFNKKEMF